MAGLRVLLMAGLTLLSACADTASLADLADAGADAASACTVPRYTDDIELAHDAAVMLPGRAYAAAALGPRHVVVCGDGFVAAVDTTARAIVSTLQEPRLSGQCAGISSSGSDRAVLVTRSGAIVLLGLAAGKLAVLSSTTRAGFLRDAFVEGQTAWIAAGTQGVVRYSLAGDAFDGGTVVPGARDARSVRKVGRNLVVADGAVAASDAKKPDADGGAEVRLISASGAGELAAIKGLPGISARVVDGGAGRVIILRRGYGFDVLSVGDTTLALDYSRSVALGAPLAGVVHDDSLLLATGSHLLRFRLGSASAERLSIEARPARGDPAGPLFRAVVSVGGVAPVLWTLMTDRLVITKVGRGDAAPHIHMEQWSHTLDRGTPQALVRIHNLGNAPLVVEGASAPPPFSAGVSEEYGTPRPGCPGQWLVAPGEVLLGTYEHDGSGGAASAKVTVTSNDPDEPEMSFAVQYERPIAQVGDTPLDFDLIAISGAQVRLADYRGKVVLVKLYNPT